MEAKIQKWGNSDGIRIPNYILKSLNIKTNDIVDISSDNNKIIIYKLKKDHLKIAERIEEYQKLSKQDKENIPNYDWGEDVGLEKWD